MNLWKTEAKQRITFLKHKIYMHTHLHKQSHTPKVGMKIKEQYSHIMRLLSKWFSKDIWWSACS